MAQEKCLARCALALRRKDVVRCHLSVMAAAVPLQQPVCNGIEAPQGLARKPIMVGEKRFYLGFFLGNRRASCCVRDHHPVGTIL